MIRTLGLAALSLVSTAALAGQLEVGAPAPDFTLSDLDGNAVTLSEHRGKTVVLEWFNPGCPFVVSAHGDGPLKGLPAEHAANGVVWLAVNSGSPGKQGHGVDENRAAAAEWGMDYPILVDESGDVGRLYGAVTTPHMYVIDAEGNVAYQGALDNAPRGNVRGGGNQVPYLDLALDAVAVGQPVSTTSTKPWGCSVKY